MMKNMPKGIISENFGNSVEEKNEPKSLETYMKLLIEEPSDK